MKKICLTLLFSVIFISSLFSQEKGDIIRLEAQVKVESVPIGFASTLSPAKQAITTDYLRSGLKYRIINIDAANNTVQLQAIKIKPYTKGKKRRYRKKYGVELTDLSEYYNEKIYTISKDDFEKYSENIEASNETREILSLGLLTLPFKARPQEEFSFDTEFNLNSTLNIRWKNYTNSSLNFQVGGGIGTVSLNSTNADGITAEEAQDVSTLTLLTGLMYESQRIQVGLYMGVDNINNQANHRWKSNGNVWFALGIGYDLFNVAVAKNTDQSQGD